MPAGSYVKRMPWGRQKPLLGYGIDWTHPLANGIVGCWLFNEGAGGIVNDLCGNLSMVGNAVWTPYNTGLHPYFNGTAKYSNINSIGKYLNSGQFTIIVDYMRQPGGSLVYLLSSYLTTGNQRSIRYGINYLNGVQLYFTTNGSTVINGSVPSPNVGAINTWYCGAVCCDGQTAQHYSNGIATTNTPAVFSGPLYAGTSPTYIGVGYNGTDSPMYGSIARAMVFNSALSPAEVAALYGEPYCFIEGWNYGRSYSVPSSAFINSSFWYQNPVLEAI